MKYLAIFVILIGCIVFIPEVLGAKQNLFEGNSSFERLPDTIIPETLYEFELKFQITDSPYWLHGISPVVDINPKTDASNVHINFEKIPFGFFAISRVPVTLYVDQNISSEKIFLNISFVSKNSSGDEMRSSWSESIVLNISQFSLPAELPSSQDYEFETMTGASCTDDSSVCFGTFHNGTTIPIQCDYRHSCGVISFSKETYKLEEKPPLKQFKHGVAINEIQCRENLVLIQKHDDSPACIFPESIQKLVERGWIGNIIKIEPEIMNAIESASIAKYALEPEFEVQRDIAKEIFKSLRTGEDTPYISFGLSNDRKSLDLYFDKTAFTLEKNEAYYQEFIDESFAEVTIPINVIFVEGKGSGDE